MKYADEIWEHNNATKYQLSKKEIIKITSEYFLLEKKNHILAMEFIANLILSTCPDTLLHYLIFVNIDRHSNCFHIKS